MKNKNIKWCIYIVIFIIVILGVLIGYKFICHENSQNQSISQLKKEINLLKVEIGQLKTKKIEWSDTDYNYLAIGNSITLHGLADYWWNEVGMAASFEDRDYVHLVVTGLETTNEIVCEHAFNFCQWEIQAADRAETFEILNPYLSEKLNLVTIQLSENVSDMSTFEVDYEELIKHIQEIAPDAQILVIDDFWDLGDKSTLKEKAANNTGVQFISLAEIKGKSEYRCGIGTTVYDANGNEHTVEHNGVASHPGDKGMEYIANAVLDALK